MIGKYDIELYNNRVHYFLTVKRNITILQGNSATGKTEFIRLIQQYENLGDSSGITLVCNAQCRVLIGLTGNSVYQYGKSRLSDVYRTDSAIRRIAAVMPESIRS